MKKATFSHYFSFIPYSQWFKPHAIIIFFFQSSYTHIHGFPLFWNVFLYKICFIIIALVVQPSLVTKHSSFLFLLSNTVSCDLNPIRTKNDFDPGFCCFSNVSEILKIISSALEEKKNIMFGHLVFRLCVKRYEIAYGKDKQTTESIPFFGLPKPKSNYDKHTPKQNDILTFTKWSSILKTSYAG